MNVYFDKGRLALLAGLAVSLTAMLGLVLIITFTDVQKRPSMLLPWFWCLAMEALFLVVLAWALARLYGNAIALVLRRDGLTDRSSLFSTKCVPWTTIERVEVASFRGGPWIGLTLKHRGLRRYASTGRGMNPTAGQSAEPIWLSPYFMKIEPATLLSMFRERIGSSS